ncbi:hypothetical protein OSB04_001325 [Centaurea solstitialis]|uniref:Reverse transcriptase Ty1/copia-type domain-containing protein n=1 Tax=Centaurea solstitialis TaxID=347529 RepID=A0AA38TSL2_9ASTR|nr:hypothetical protein OSB04_001325 [Centaurea solstitialis]
MRQPPGYVDSAFPDHVYRLHKALYGHKQAPRACTPADTKTKLAADGEHVSDPTLYRSLVSALQYLTFTHPDIAYAVQQVCLFMHDPHLPHSNALKRILRYLKGTLSHGLHIKASAVDRLVAYSDANWAGCPNTRRSTSGFCVYLGDNLVSWSSIRQHVVSHSSAEAEYRGIANVVAEAAWLRNFLLELSCPLSHATVVFCDNVSAMYLTSSPVQHQRTKHVKIDLHFVRERVAIGHVRVLHVPFAYQYADIFTKGLPSSLFLDFRDSLNIRVPPDQTTGFSVLDIFDPNKWYQSKFDLENQLTMDTQETVLVSKVPMLKPNEFDMWKIRIRQYMLLTDYGMWEVVENGPGTDEEAAEGGARPPPRSDADRKRRQTEMKALSTMLLAIPNEYQHLFSSCIDAKVTIAVNTGSGTKQTQETSPPIVMFPMPLTYSNVVCTTDETESDQQKEPENFAKSDDQQTEETSFSNNIEVIPASDEGPQWDQEPEVNDSNLEVDLPEEPLHLTRTQKNHPPSLVIGDIQSLMITRKQSRTITNPHSGMISVFLSQTEPKKAHDAMKDPSWIEAMQEKLLQFVLQHVWDLVDLPRGHRVIGTKWIFRNKTDERVARIEAIGLFLAFASYKGFKVYQMDVKSAFLYGTIDEEVYVSQPPGFEDPKYPDKVYKLRKALYGLHQAPRAWYDTLSSYLLENKFERGFIDKTLYIKRTKTDMFLVQIYVDDIIFGSTRDDMCKEFEELMHKKFKMSSMGELTFFLGIQVKQKTDGIFINQSKYVASMLQKFGLNEANPASTPMETHKHLTADVEGEEVDVHNYRSMIGSLMYLTASKPDIMFAVCVCARYQVRPKESHLHAVKRIFKYLKGQPRLGLWYPNDSSFDLVAYTDSDYGGANLDRKSTSGGCQFLGGRLVSWQCKKQTTVSQSTTEAEYIAASQCCSQVLWIQNQMQDYDLSFLQTPIYIDNNSAISIVNNPVKHSKTKHIEIKYHFIRDCNEKKLIQVLKVHTDDQYADLFTKAFDVGRFTFLVTSVGMMNSE